MWEDALRDAFETWSRRPHLEVVLANWPNFFFFFAACMFRATLKDRLLLNLTSSMKRHEKKPQQAEWITHCLVFMWFTVMSIMCFRGLLTCRCSQQMFVNTTSVLTTERVTTTTQTPSTGRLILGVNIQLFLSPVSIDFTIYTDFMKEDNILFKANIYIFTNSVKSNYQRQLLWSSGEKVPRLPLKNAKFCEL